MAVSRIARGLVACALVAPLMLVGCGGGDAEEQPKREQTQQTESSQESEDDVFAGGEEVPAVSGARSGSKSATGTEDGGSAGPTTRSGDPSATTTTQVSGDSASKDADVAADDGTDKSAGGDASSVASSAPTVAKGVVTANELVTSESAATPSEMRPALRSVSAFTDSADKPQGAAEEGWWRTVSVSGVVENVSDSTELDARCLPEMSVCGTKLEASIDGGVVKPGESAVYSYSGTVRIPEGVQVTWGAGNGECDKDGIDADDSSGEPHAMDQIGADGASQLVAKLIAQTKFGNRKLTHS